MKSITFKDSHTEYVHYSTKRPANISKNPEKIKNIANYTAFLLNLNGEAPPGYMVAKEQIYLGTCHNVRNDFSGEELLSDPMLLGYQKIIRKNKLRSINY